MLFLSKKKYYFGDLKMKDKNSGYFNPDDELSGLFDDDGIRINPELIPKPTLCMTCKNDDLGGEQEILCLLNRHDQKDEKEFNCGAYQPKFKKE